MPTTKRALSSASPTGVPSFTSRTSEFNPRVTLFEAPGIELESSPRRSKRIKTETKREGAIIGDLEDFEPVPMSIPKTTPKKSSKTTDTKFPIPSFSKPHKYDVKFPKKAKIIPQALDSPHPAPAKWRETYDAIKAMRSRFIAPVDTMGCQLAQVKETLPKNRRYATLVSLMLSSQTKDKVTSAAVENLRDAFGGSISIDAMIAADDSTISQAIAKVGFWTKKTKYLKQAAIHLRDRFDSEVPKTVDELCSLPGVGPKMAFLALQMAWDVHDGIGVDVHVHRITNLLGWHRPPTKQPEQTRLNLQSWLPKELYSDINHMMVGFGQVICLPVAPRCDVCDLSAKGLCPSAQKVTSKNRKPIDFLKGDESPSKVTISLEEADQEEKKSPANP